MEKTKKLFLKVSAEQRDLRLDQYIIKELERAPAISRSRIQRLIQAGKILVNGNLSKADYKVKANDVVRINIPEAVQPKILPEKVPLEIIYEDEDLLIINKPAGMVTHPAAPNFAHTLVNALLGYGCALSALNGPQRPGIVHRLDKDTSGLIVVAKNDLAHLDLAEQFRRHTVKRKYIAIVKGRVEQDEGIIDLPLARHPRNRQKIRVSFLKSRPALTRYRLLKRYKDTSVLELIPHTGRTHQLRVHLKFCGYPILGDTRYGGGGELRRLALHATELGFRHPRRKEFVQFRSELPKYLKDFLQSLK